jgi:hypothetical protein
MLGITGDHCATLHIGLGKNPATDTAIRARRAYRRRMVRGRIHQ